MRKTADRVSLTSGKDALMKVLIVVDLQNDFTTGALGNEQCAAAAAKAAEKIREFRKEGFPIFATLDTHSENYMETREGKALPVIHCVKGTPGHDLDPIVAEALGDEYIPVEKVTFGSKDLPRIICENTDADKIEEFQVIGVCTDICVISNAMILRAFFPETPIRIISDCCGGVTPDSHNNALEAMRMCQMIID